MQTIFTVLQEKHSSLDHGIDGKVRQYNVCATIENGVNGFRKISKYPVATFPVTYLYNKEVQENNARSLCHLLNKNLALVLTRKGEHIINNTQQLEAERQANSLFERLAKNTNPKEEPTPIIKNDVVKPTTTQLLSEKLKNRVISAFFGGLQKNKSR